MSDKYIRQEENIKDCPFCGSSVSVERVPLKHYKGCVTFEIKCLNCGCERTLMKNDSVYRTEEEARANAIAQWNERLSPAAVPHEMSAREFAKAYRRMCESYPYSCENCPVTLNGNHECALPEMWEVDYMIDMLPIVEKWAREHPEEGDRK